MPPPWPAVPTLERVQAALPYLWMLLGSVAFAVMATLAHFLSDHCAWQVIALVRASVACLAAIMLTLAAGARLVLWRPGTLWLRSIAGSVSMVCTFYSFAHLPPSDVLTLTNMFPLWVALLCWPVLNQVPTASVWLSVASGVVGVVLIQQPHFAEGNFASLIALASSVSTAVAMLGLHRLHDVDPRAVVAHFSGVSILFCTAAFFLFERQPARDNSLIGGDLLLLLAIGGTATIGQLLLTLAFAAGPPARVSVVGLTQIVFAVLLELALGHGTLGPMRLVGMAFVIAPTAWVLTHRPEKV